MAILWKNIWTSRTNGVVMSNIARAPRYAESRTVYRSWPPLTSAPKLSPARKRVWRNSRSRESFSACIATVRDDRSIRRTFSVLVFCRLGSEKLTNIISVKGFEHAYALAFILSAISIAGKMFENIIYFKNYSTWSPPMLKWARKSVVFISSTKWTCNAQLVSDMTLNAASPVATGFMIGGYEWNERKN